MRGKRALACGILLQPRLLGNFHFFCAEIWKNKDRKKENKLFFTFHDSVPKLQASPCGNISADEDVLDCAC